MIDLDAFLIDAVKRDTIPDFASPSDHFSTAGGLQFDFVDNPRRLRSGHVLDFKGATLELDVDRVTDAMLLSEQALIMIGSEQANIYGKVGEEAFAAISTGINVINVNLIANYSKLAPRAQALGVKQFSIAGCGIQGHDAHANVTLRDFGAYGREGFPVFIAGADNSFDQHALYSVDPKHVFDENTPASSLEYKFLDFNPELSRSIIDGREVFHQVTVGMILGALCPGTLVPNPWSMSAPWRHMMRRDASLKFDVSVPAGGRNSVQGGTIYQSLHGTVDGRTENASVMYYSDYFKSKGVHILPTCKALGWCEYGAMIRLSPTASGYPDIPPDFSAEDFVIEYFESKARNTDVFLNADLLPGVDKNPPTRYLRNIAIDERLSVSGNKEGLVVIPAPSTKRGGCLSRLGEFFP
jgi:hypothetical protein